MGSTRRKMRKKILFQRLGFKDGLGHDEKTGQTEEEPMHEDFGQIHDLKNPQEKEV
jgi:hypothetical protein